MAHILITSGPTRQYLDPVRYLTNASSGRMGRALAEAALELGHRVTVVSGPVEVAYPADARVLSVISTSLLAWAKDLWSRRGRGSATPSSETGQDRQAVTATESTNER